MKKCLKTRILPFVCLLALLITALVVPIGAEVTPPTPPTYTPTYDYPGANLIPYPYVDLKESGDSYSNKGITYTLQNYGIVISGGSATGTSVLTLASRVPLEPGTYSCGSFVSGCYLNFDFYDINTGEWLFTNYETLPTWSFTIDSPYLCNIYLFVQNGVSLNSVSVYPMLNEGAQISPYQPYLPYYFQQAFNDGWNQSYVGGYTAGLDAASKGVNNLFYGAALRVSFGDESDFIRYNFSYDQIPYNKGVLRLGDLPGISAEAWSMPNVDVSFIWPTGGEWYYPNGFVKTNADDGTRDVFVGAVVTNPLRGSFGNAVDAYLSSDPSGFRSVEFDYPYYRIKQLSFQIMEGYPLQDIAFVSQSYQYNVGYDNGYTSGFNEGQSTSYQTGYDAGDSAGYKRGYFLGKEDGLKIAENGTFTALMSAVVDAPVKALTGLLDFEILGQNMLSFFGALLSLSLLLIFIKKVVL